MRLPLLAALLLLVSACGGPEPAPPTSGPRAPAPRALAADPAPTDDELAAAAATDAGDAAIEALDPARRVAVLRAGLRLPPGPAAAACARALDWKHLDADEQALATRQIVDELLRPDAEPEEGEFWYVLEHVASDDLDWLLARLARADPERLERTTVALLHKVVRPRHLPAIAELLTRTDRRVPDQLAELLWLAADHTDRERDALARAFLGDRPPAPIASTPVAAAPGVPPALRDCLQFLFLRAEAKGGGHWAGRWLRDVVPVAADADLLVRLDDAGYHDDLALWHMRHLDDDLTRARLDELADLGDPDPAGFQMFAWGALAERGEAAAGESLRPVAAREGIALALLLRSSPRDAVEALARVLLDPTLEDDWRGPLSQCFAAIEEARRRVRLHYGIEWDERAFDGFEERALASDVDGLRLARIGLSVPGCRTERVAAEAARRLRRSPPDGWFATHVPARALGFLEVGAPAELRDTLRAWARSDDAQARRAALGTLLAIGDPESGPALVAGLRRDELSPDERGLAALANSPGDAVRAYLRGVVAEEQPPPRGASRWQAVQALARLDGMPAAVAFERPDGTADEEAELARRVLAGDWTGAYVAVLAAAPDVPHPGAGEVRDPRVSAYLRRLLAERHLGRYAFATAELAIQGDPAARAEHLRVLRAGHYRWAEHLDERQATLAGDLAETVPIWLDALESNCCQAATARALLAATFGVSEHTGGYGFTDAAWFRRWWAEHEGPFVRSRLADAWLPAPR